MDRDSERDFAARPGVGGWKGTPPAEGTRRKLILDTLEDLSIRLISGNGGKPTSGSCLEAADAIEEALIRVVDNGATPESGSPASVAMDTLDGLGVPRTDGGRILTIADRVTVAADELVEARRQIVRLLDDEAMARGTDALAPRFAEERDCAFAILRWLLPVTVAKRID